MSDKEKNSTLSSEVEKINAIRDIIFGSDMQQYNQRFEDLKKELHDTQEEHKRSINEVTQSLEDKIAKLSDDFQAFQKEMVSKIDAISNRIDQVEDSKVDRKKLATLLDSISNELTKA